jgi:hypothetical protein
LRALITQYRIVRDRLLDFDTNNSMLRASLDGSGGTSGMGIGKEGPSTFDGGSSSSTSSSIGATMPAVSIRLLSDPELKALGEELANEEKLKAGEMNSLQVKYQDARDELAALKEAAVRSNS